MILLTSNIVSYCQYYCQIISNFLLICIMISSASLAAEDPLDANSRRNRSHFSPFQNLLRRKQEKKQLQQEKQVSPFFIGEDRHIGPFILFHSKILQTFPTSIFLSGKEFPRFPISKVNILRSPESFKYCAHAGSLATLTISSQQSSLLRLC